VKTCGFVDCVVVWHSFKKTIKTYMALCLVPEPFIDDRCGTATRKQNGAQKIKSSTNQCYIQGTVENRLPVAYIVSGGIPGWTNSSPIQECMLAHLDIGLAEKIYDTCEQCAHFGIIPAFDFDDHRCIKIVLGLVNFMRYFVPKYQEGSIELQAVAKIPVYCSEEFKLYLRTLKKNGCVYTFEDYPGNMSFFNCVAKGIKVQTYNEMTKQVEIYKNCHTMTVPYAQYLTGVSPQWVASSSSPVSVNPKRNTRPEVVEEEGGEMEVEASGEERILTKSRYLSTENNIDEEEAVSMNVVLDENKFFKLLSEKLGSNKMKYEFKKVEDYIFMETYFGNVLLEKNPHFKQYVNNIFGSIQTDIFDSNRVEQNVIFYYLLEQYIDILRLDKTGEDEKDTLCISILHKIKLYMFDCELRYPAVKNKLIFPSLRWLSGVSCMTPLFARNLNVVTLNMEYNRAVCRKVLKRVKEASIISGHEDLKIGVEVNRNVVPYVYKLSECDTFYPTATELKSTSWRNKLNETVDILCSNGVNLISTIYKMKAKSCIVNMPNLPANGTSVVSTPIIPIEEINNLTLEAEEVETTASSSLECTSNDMTTAGDILMHELQTAMTKTLANYNVTRSTPFSTGKDLIYTHLYKLIAVLTLMYILLFLRMNIYQLLVIFVLTPLYFLIFFTKKQENLGFEKKITV
jgi:hypothetical protein